MAEFQTVRGMRDFLPETALKKQLIEDACRRVFESYGFQPLETPVVEDLGLLSKKGSGGEAIRDEIYCFKDKGGRELGLRFDLTVPLARVAAENKEIPRPFKRYAIGKVYRYDRPGASRYREFTQADIDILGSGSALADFECLSASIEIMQRLGLKFKVRLSNRKLLEELALCCDVEKGRVEECFRCLDKLDKIGKEGVAKELREKGIGKKILEVVESNRVEEAEKIMKRKEGLEELNALISLLKKAKLAKFVEVDLSLARGLEYYTGNVFEIAIENGPSVAGGGRYDNLVEAYGGQKTPAVGISLGVDRILDALGEKLRPEARVKVFIAPLGGKAVEESLRVASEIRGLGIGCELDLMNRGIGKNIEYADKKGIPFVAILGENELRKKSLALKNLKTGKQKTVKLSELKKLKNLLK